MRATYLALRLLTTGCLLSSVMNCAQGGIDDDELNNVGSGDDDDSPRDAGKAKDAGKDARVSSGNDDEDEPPASTNRDAGSKDAGAGSSSKDAGGSGGGTKLKCPSPMVCDATLSPIFSVFDTTVKSGDTLCATPGGPLPASLGCSNADACKTAGLTTATCVAGSCVQPCSP